MIRGCKNESKRKSYESSERRFNHPSLRLKDLQAEKMPKIIERPGHLKNTPMALTERVDVESNYSFLENVFHD